MAVYPAVLAQLEVAAHLVHHFPLLVQQAITLLMVKQHAQYAQQVSSVQMQLKSLSRAATVLIQ
jgi:hypothetical protein